MEVNIITQKDLEQFKDELFQELQQLFQNIPQAKEGKKPLQQEKWLKSYQVQRLLGISPGTLQNLRINGTIPYSKLGGILLYPTDEITKLINDNMRNK